jgi:hypothetical protein
MTKEELIQEIWDKQQKIFDSCGMFSKEQALNESVELLEVYISKLHQTTVSRSSPIIEGKTKSNVKNNTQTGRLAPPPPPIKK